MSHTSVIRTIRYHPPSRISSPPGKWAENTLDKKKTQVLGPGRTNINIAGELLGYRISLTTIEGSQVDPTEVVAE